MCTIETEREVFFCPKCLYVVKYNEVFGQSGSKHQCIEQKCLFSIDDFKHVKRGYPFNDDNLIRIRTYLKYYYIKQFSIRAISQKFQLKKYFVEKCLYDSSIKKSNETKVNAGQKAQRFIRNLNQKIIIKPDELLKHKQKSIKKETFDNKIRILYQEKRCSPQVIRHIFANHLNTSLFVHYIRKYIQTLKLEYPIEYVYKMIEELIFIKSSVVLNHLLTYKYRKKEKYWSETFFRDKRRISRFLNWRGIHIDYQRLRDVFDVYQLNDKLLHDLSNCAYNVQQDFTYTFGNGYKLVVQFEDGDGKLISLNDYCQSKKGIILK